MEETLEHIKFLARYWGRAGLQYMVITLLLELSVPTGCDGFDYLKESIILYYEDPMQTITKGLYPAVADQYDCFVDGTQIESSIRNAIRKAWKNRNENNWRRYFPPNIYGEIPKPSNTEFISRIARVLELWKGCCEAYEQQSYK